MKEQPRGLQLVTDSPLLGPYDATILQSGNNCLHQILASFSPVEVKEELKEGEEKVKKKKAKFALGIPGRMYVNGTDNLLKYCKSHRLINEMVDKFSWQVWVRELKKPQQKYSVDEEPVVDNKAAPKRNINKVDKPNLEATHYIVMMAPKGYDNPQMQNSLNQGIPLKAEATSFANFWNLYLESTLQETTVEKDELDKNWFLVSDVGFTGYSTQDVLATETEEMKGTVKSLILPFGGTVALESGELALFHKTNVIVDGNLTGFIDQLNLKVGTKVVVDVVPNVGKEDEEPPIPGFQGKYIAATVFVGEKHERELVKPFDGVRSNDGLHRINICELYEDPDGSGTITSGLGIIQYSNLIRSKKASESMVGEYVKFHSKNMWFCGVNLSGIDLIHLYKAGDSIDVSLTMLDTKDNKAQYEMKAGYSGLTYAADMLLPENQSIQKKLHERSMDFDTVEKILTKKLGPCAASMPETTALGRVIQIDKPEHKQTTSKGTIVIETGKHKGKKIKLNRAKMSVLGFNLENADLLYCVISHEHVYVDVSGIDDYPEGMYVPQFIRFLSPSEYPTVTDIDTFTVEQKFQLILWLNMRAMSYSCFKKVLENKAPSRYFIPFPKFQYQQFIQGRVVNLDPIKNPKKGCTSGLVVVDQGYQNLEQPNQQGKGNVNIKGELVCFHAFNLWVFGRKCGQADLSYLLQPHQRVNLEIEELTDEMRKSIPDLPKNVNYRASMAWIGPTRPRNDRDDPNKNDKSIFEWLSKRGLNIKSFTKLIEGGMTPHRQMELDIKNFYLAPLVDRNQPMIAKLAIQAYAEAEGVEEAPVLRHGQTVANMLETCIQAAGPLDPRLMMLIENDEMAQAAFHVSEALKFALTHYRERTNQPFNGMMGGSAGGDRGPMMGGRGGNGRGRGPMLGQAHGFPPRQGGEGTWGGRNNKRDNMGGQGGYGGGQGGYGGGQGSGRGGYGGGNKRGRFY